MSKFNMDSLKSKTVPTPATAFAEMMGGEGKQYVKEIPIEQLEEITDQPFKPYHKDKLEELAKDIKENGLLAPLIVREVQSGTYEILAGRNRYNACKINGMETVSCIVKDVDDITANLILVNSNLNQRHRLLHSEKAYAYKMQMDCLKKKSGTRTDLVHNVHKVDTTKEISNQEEESRRNIAYYIRLTYLNKQLLDMVDEKTLPFRAGVELSYLEENEQRVLIEYLANNEKEKITVAQAEDLKQLSKVESLTYAILEDFFNKKEMKPKEKSKDKIVKIKKSRIEEILGNSFDDKELESIIEKALLLYHKHTF